MFFAYRLHSLTADEMWGEESSDEQKVTYVSGLASVAGWADGSSTAGIDAGVAWGCPNKPGCGRPDKETTTIVSHETQGRSWGRSRVSH